MLLIYTSNITNRILYTMQYVFEERLGLTYQLINNRNEFENNTKELKIAYTNEAFKNCFIIHSHTLLFDEDIKRIEIKEGLFNNIKTLFTTDNVDFPFDIFSAIFYLLSRYEEYLDYPLDQHGNYVHTNSILFKLNLLDAPIIEQWIELLKEVLLKKFPSLQFKKHVASFALSFDIDVAYAYKNRSAIRTIGGFAKKIVSLNFSEAKNQLAVLQHRKNDIFDTYDYIFSIIKNKEPIFFFDMGEYGKFDKNPSSKNKNFQKLIKNISRKAMVGLHPSYASNTNKNLVVSEKNILEKITGSSIKASRQHYLKLKLPDTYNNLLQNNLTEDYTIGYSAAYGFRAGTCNSFLFFDLIKNETTQLRLFPFTYMDVTLNNYLQLSIPNAKDAVSNLAGTIQKYNGIFIPLWHNSTLCDFAEWKGWREVFEHTIKEIDDKNFKNIFE